MLAEGRGVARNEVTAMHWFRLAADQGHAPSQTYIGYLYEHGRGVPRNRAEAIRWYRRAAMQGDATALQNLQALGVGP